MYFIQMKHLIGAIFKCAGYGATFASIVYFLERTNTPPILTEDIIAFFMSIGGIIFLTLSIEFSEVS